MAGGVAFITNADFNIDESISVTSVYFVSYVVIPARMNCASTCRNHSLGSGFQKGGGFTTTRDTCEDAALSFVFTVAFALVFCIVAVGGHHFSVLNKSPFDFL